MDLMPSCWLCMQGEMHRLVVETGPGACGVTVPGTPCARATSAAWALSPAKGWHTEVLCIENHF